MFFTESPGFWAYFLIAVGTMLEGPIVTLASGFTASTGLLNPFGVFAAAALGNLIGDTTWYILGYLGRVQWLYRYSRFLPIQKEQVEEAVKDIHKHAPKLLFIAKLTLGLSIPTLIAAGLARVPLRRWYWAQVSAEILWTGALTILGYYFGHSLQVVQNGIHLVAIFSSLLFLFILFLYFKSLSLRLKE